MIGAAIMVAKIATGEVEDNATAPDKAHHSAGGKKGGAARAAALTPEQQSEIAKKATAKQWSYARIIASASMAYSIDAQTKARSFRTTSTP